MDGAHRGRSSRAVHRTLRRLVLRGLVVAGALAALPACATYYEDYRFRPAPDVVTVRVGDEDASARVLATVAGVRRPDDERPAEVEVRLRIESLSEPARLLPDRLLLVTSGLADLPAVRVEPAAPEVVVPGGTQTLTAYFPLPPGADPDDLDLEGLDVRWTLDVGGRRVTSSSSFLRREPPRVYYHRDPWYDPWYDPWWPYPWHRGGLRSRVWW